MCHKGLNSNYIRLGAKESFKKIGLYCITCDIYYSPNLQKQYIINSNQYLTQINSIQPSFHKQSPNKESLGRELNPRPLPYQGNALARLSYQGILL